ncbi:MAG: 4'-phosphopantetheinyl transferase family protein [Planctomycetota bacterium]
MNVTTPRTHPAMQLSLWHTTVQEDAGRMAMEAGVLSESEAVRARSYRFEADRDRFVLGRTFLRTILGGMLDAPPASLVFEEGGGRKPVLVGPQAARVAFNLSASGDHVLCATAAGREIGVDVEVSRSIADLSDVAARIMGEAEWAAWDAEPSDRRLESFYERWTSKEALGKARGTGISEGLHELVVPARLADATCACVRDLDGTTNWLLSTVLVAPGVPAAVAIEARGGEASITTYDDAQVHAGSQHEGVVVPRATNVIVRSFRAPAPGQ